MIVIFGEGGATSMARDTAGTMLQSFEAIKEAVGLDIPKMLKDVSTGGLVGKASTSEDASMDGKDADDMTADVPADDVPASEDK